MWQLILLGIVQGLTEFLPISSSGHLVLVGRLVHSQTDSLQTAVWLHLGTLAATCVVYRAELVSLLLNDRGRALAVLVALVPAGVVGLGWHAEIESVFGDAHCSAPITALLLVATALIMVLGERLFAARSGPAGRVGPGRALVIGLAQAAAILPGTSRSGLTIAAGLACGVERQAAANFSFLLAVPTVAGAVLVDLWQAADTATSVLPSPAVLVGAAVSFLTGLLALKSFLYFVRRWPLYCFSVYCALLGMAVLAITRPG